MKIKFNLSLFILLFISLYSGFVSEYLSIFSVLLFHELGHVLMICLFKGKIKGFEISPMGCFIDFNNINLNKIQRIIVYISGIVFNLILSFFLKDAYLLKYNNYLLIFNLLIIYPLDGYRVLEEVLDIFYEKEYLNRLMFIISIVCSITFFVLIFYIKYYGYLIILIYLNYKNYINYKSQRLKYKSEFYKNSFLLTPSVSK